MIDVAPPLDAVDPLGTHDAGIGAERILLAIADVVVRLTAIEAALSERATAAPVSRVDQHLHAAIAPEVSAAVGALVWTVRELIDDAARDDPALFRVLDEAIGLDGRRIGRFLARVAGVTLNGFRVERVGEDRNGVAWRIVRC